VDRGGRGRLKARGERVRRRLLPRRGSRVAASGVARRCGLRSQRALPRTGRRRGGRAVERTGGEMEAFVGISAAVVGAHCLPRPRAPGPHH
jgi:hypothetical protein